MKKPVRKLSVVIPVYNEAGTLAEIVQRVLAVELPVEREIVVVDDGSTDGSDRIASELARRHPEVRAFRQERNRGKGAALRAGFAQAAGDVILVQDADLEYDPNDYGKLLTPIIAGRADVVFGSRTLRESGRGQLMFYLGGRVVSAVTNLLYAAHVSDEPTCYKVFRRSVLDRIRLTCTGFEFCPEFTAKVLKAGYVIHEVPIRYYPRTRAEGKKVTWRDGVQAIWTLVKYRLFAGEAP